MKSTYKVFGQFVKMSAIDKAKFKASIELFYKNNKSKIKTYNEFKNFKSNGCPIFSKRGIYNLMKKIDDRGTCERKWS